MSQRFRFEILLKLSTVDVNIELQVELSQMEFSK